MSKPNNILALDVGDARIGAAIANDIAKIPRPLTILENDNGVFDRAHSLVKEHDIRIIVIGLPRNMKGGETKQSIVSREFAERLKSYITVPIVFADESLSTARAEKNRLQDRRPKSKPLDDIAACFILEEYFKSNQ